MKKPAIQFVHNHDGDGIAILIDRSVISVNRFGTITKRRKQKNDELMRTFNNDLYVESLKDFRLGWTYEMGGYIVKLVDNNLFGLRFLAFDRDGNSQLIDKDYDVLCEECAENKIKMVQAVL